jgi:hypothetical protein
MPAAQSGIRIPERAWPARWKPEGPPSRVADALLRGLCPDLQTGSLAWPGSGRDQLSARGNHQHDCGWRRRFRSFARSAGVERRRLRNHPAGARAAPDAVARSRWRGGKSGTKAPYHASHDPGTRGEAGRSGRFADGCEREEPARRSGCGHYRPDRDSCGQGCGIRNRRSPATATRFGAASPAGHPDGRPAGFAASNHAATGTTTYPASGCATANSASTRRAQGSRPTAATGRNHAKTSRRDVRVAFAARNDNAWDAPDSSRPSGAKPRSATGRASHRTRHGSAAGPAQAGRAGPGQSRRASIPTCLPAFAETSGSPVLSFAFAEAGSGAARASNSAEARPSSGASPSTEAARGLAFGSPHPPTVAKTSPARGPACTRATRGCPTSRASGVPNRKASGCPRASVQVSPFTGHIE